MNGAAVIGPQGLGAGQGEARGGLLRVWRHPRLDGVAGRCIGARSDVPVDPRKAKRLAHQIRQCARRQGGARVVFTSPLQRCRRVGAWLRQWGWRHRIDARLAELDFGLWDGRDWAAIGAESLDAWCADFSHHAPGQGESVTALLARCRSFVADARAGTLSAAPVYAVSHAGWLSALQTLHASNHRALSAADWPPPLAYGACIQIEVSLGNEVSLAPLGKEAPAATSARGESNETPH